MTRGEKKEGVEDRAELDHRAREGGRVERRTMAGNEEAQDR